MLAYRAKSLDILLDQSFSLECCLHCGARGVWALVFGAMVPLGNLEAGTLAQWFGTPVVIAIGAVVCAIAALVTVRAVRRRDAAEAAVSAAATVD